jgi:transcriptional regulator with XRE-family HTH domain
MSSDIEVGRRLEALRRHKGMSRERLASLAEVSAILIKSIETGRRALTLRTAQRIAPVLGVEDLGELYGPTVRLSLDGRPTHPDVPKVRVALTTWQLKTDGTADSAEYLRGAVDAAWQTWHRSANQRTEAGALLPGLIDRGRRAARLHTGDERRKTLIALADVYHLTQAYLAWHGERELLWLTVDRGVSAAMDADDPIAMAWSTFYAAHLLRAVGRSDEALEQLGDAVELVQPTMEGNTDVAELIASLHLCAGLTRARTGDQGAWADWEAARAVVYGQLLENHVPRSTHPVDRALIDVQATMIAVELGEPEEAQRRAHSLDPDKIKSLPWRASHLILLARGADLDGSREATLHLLTRAAEASPETVQYSPVARDMIERLVREAGATIRPQVEALARRTGILAG